MARRNAIPKMPKSLRSSANLDSESDLGLIKFLFCEAKEAKPDDVVVADFFDVSGSRKPGIRVEANKLARNPLSTPVHTGARWVAPNVVSVAPCLVTTKFGL